MPCKSGMQVAPQHCKTGGCNGKPRNIRLHAAPRFTFSLSARQRRTGGDYSGTVAFLAQFGHLTYNLISITSHVTGEKSERPPQCGGRLAGERWTPTGKREISSAVRLGSPYGNARRGCLSNVVIQLTPAPLIRSNLPVQAPSYLEFLHVCKRSQPRQRRS